MCVVDTSIIKGIIVSMNKTLVCFWAPGPNILKEPKSQLRKVNTVKFKHIFGMMKPLFLMY